MSSVRRLVSRKQKREGQGARMPDQPEQRTVKGRRKHLYFAFDDWNYGYTIRKVPSSPGSGESEGEGEVAKQRLRGVITRIFAPRGFADFFTLAFGTKILVFHPGAIDEEGIPIIDVKDRSFTFGPVMSFPSCPIYFPVGDDRLFALDIGTFDCLRMPERGKPWLWHHLNYPPFPRAVVSSHAVRPDGCILVSTKSDATGAMATFVFDTKEYVWKPYGDWAFPFTSRGHYDADLEAFVGLSKDPEKLGYLYSCTIACTGTGDTSNMLHPSLDWKCSKETVYNNNPAESHVSATLVHMRRGKFCLVECVSVDGVTADQLRGMGAAQELRETGADQELRETGADQELKETGADQELRELVDHPVWQPGVVNPVWQELWNRQEEFFGVEEEILETEDPGSVPHCGHFMYRVKTFSLRYDVNGDLKLKRCRVRCYSLPHEASVDFLEEGPVAFWL